MRDAHEREKRKETAGGIEPTKKRVGSGALHSLLLLSLLLATSSLLRLSNRCFGCERRSVRCAMKLLLLLDRRGVLCMMCAVKAFEGQLGGGVGFGEAGGVVGLFRLAGTHEHRRIRHEGISSGNGLGSRGMRWKLRGSCVHL